MFGDALALRDEVEEIDCHNTILLGFNATNFTAYPAAIPLFNKAVSPFDNAIRGIAADEDVLIACPYITLEYLESILERTASWRLLTDVEEWLGNYSTNEREVIREFVAHHHDRVHDVRNLHAKAVVGETGALVGSANLTWTGLQSRDELAVRFDEAERIEELREWFDGVWAESTSANLDDIDEHIRSAGSVPNSTKHSRSTSIASDSRRINASITKLEESKPKAKKPLESEDGSSHERLVERVKDAPTHEWIDRHFDLIAELLSVTELAENDQILVLSVPSSGGIHVTINHRYVLTAMRTARNRTEFILSNETKDVDQYIQQATEHYQFENQDDVPGPHLVMFEDGLQRVQDAEFKRGWKLGLINEVENRWQRAPKRDSHEPAVYKAAVDREYRKSVLNEAFAG